MRLGKHLDAWVASASAAWASEPAKNTQVEKRKLFRRSLYCDNSGVEGLPLPPTVLMSNSFVLLKYTTRTFVLPVYIFFGLAVGMRYRGTSAVFRWNFPISIWGNGRSHGEV